MSRNAEMTMADQSADPVCSVAGNRTVPCAANMYQVKVPAFVMPPYSISGSLSTAVGRSIASRRGGEAGDTPTIGETNPIRLRAWKRRQFHAWLDKIGLDGAQKILEERR